MVDQRIRMDVNETLELDYLVEEVSRNIVDINKNPNGLSKSHYSTDTFIFDPSGTGTYEIEIKNQVIEIEVTSVPESVVSRSDDNNFSSGIIDGGLEFQTFRDFNGIAARVSNNTSPSGNAYLMDENLNRISSIDISGISSGDAFEFEGVDIPSGIYVIYIDANGAGYHSGGHSYPYTGSELDITGTYSGGSVSTSNQPRSINDIGNPDNILG